MSRFLPLTVADWARILVLAGLYVMLGKLNFSLAVASDYVALTVFIPAGIALAFALHYGYRVWPGVFIGQWLLLTLSGQSFATGLPVAAGNSIEAVLGVWLFQRFRLQCAFERPRDVSGLILLSALVLQPISATLGTLPLWLDSRVNVTEWMPLWASWWLANVMAQLLFTPLVLTWFSANAAGQPQRLSRLGTAFPVSVLAIAVGLLVFGRLGMDSGNGNHRYRRIRPLASAGSRTRHQHFHYWCCAGRPVRWRAICRTQNQRSPLAHLRTFTERHAGKFAQRRRAVVRQRGPRPLLEPCL
jgi:integral membrane sensor domain MASE1